jgi:hypothetical protein
MHFLGLLYKYIVFGHNMSKYINYTMNLKNIFLLLSKYINYTMNLENTCLYIVMNGDMKYIIIATSSNGLPLLN